MKNLYSHQVSATFARNNFKSVTEKVLKEGMCVIVKKSKPITVILSLNEYEKLKRKKKYKKNKMPLKEIQKKSRFSKFIGCMDEKFSGMSSVDLQHNWANNVD